MGTISNPWSVLVAGRPVDAVELKTFWDTIRSEFNGNIDNANIKAGAGIDGAKLADNTITGAKLVDLTVATIKLADLSVTTGKINTAAVQDGKVDWTSLRGLRTPHIANRKTVWGVRTITPATWAGPAASNSQTFAFTTGNDSPSNFASGTPVFVCSVQHTEGTGVRLTPTITALSSTSVTVVLTHDDLTNITPAANILINWLAIGVA